jgi:hypothetical protein
MASKAAKRYDNPPTVERDAETGDMKVKPPTPKEKESDAVQAGTDRMKGGTPEQLSAHEQEVKDMHKRHETEMADMHKRHLKELGGVKEQSAEMPKKAEGSAEDKVATK